MCIRQLLIKYFKLQQKNNFENFQSFSNKYINNDKLVEEINLMNNFKNNWRKKIGSILTKESFKIIEIYVNKYSDYTKVFVKVNHSFILENAPSLHTSSEILNFIFILTKKKYTWIITDIINKEYFPSMYRTVSEKDKYTIEDNTNNYYYDYKINYWKIKSMNIENLKKQYDKTCSMYRSNYIDRSYPMKYNYKEAINYARKYAINYNSEYKHFDNAGGDCTNFVCQCIHAGGINTTSTWKPYSNSWIRVNELYYYLTRKGIGVDDTSSKTYNTGSIIQFYTNTKNYFSHSGLITASLPNGDYLYCCHSYDKLDFPLSEVYPFYFDRIRVIKIMY